MEFKDFYDNPKDLIGKKVLHTYGHMGKVSKRSIHTITHVTTRGFSVTEDKKITFKLDGYSKTEDKYSTTIDYCELKTEEEIIEIQQQWRNNKIKKDLLANIQEKLDTVGIEVLEKVKALLEE